jgi:hypothetical protein
MFCSYYYFIPYSYSNEDDGRNNPDNEIGGWEWPSFCVDLDESDNTRDDHKDGQR